MTQVRDYEFKDLSSAKSAAPGIRPFKETNFEVHPEQKVKETSERTDSHFRVDQTVAGQLGLEQREKQLLEDRVKKEIDRRWEIASGKAEVEGFKRGLDEGKKEAYQAELPRIQERLQKMDAFLAEMDTLREKIFIANESFLMDLVGQVAKLIILKEVQVDREYLHRVVISLLHQLGTKEDVKIFLSQDDFSNADYLAQAIGKEFGKLSNLQIEVNHDIPVGGCKVETRFGVMDASVETQIQNVMKALRG